MANLYFRQLDFYHPDRDELKHIRRKQNILIFKVFMTRFIIYTILVIIGTLFQRLARLTIPHMFSSEATVSRLYIIATFIEVGISIISLTQLLIYHKLIYNPKKHELVKVNIVKKYTVTVDDQIITVRFRWATVTHGDDFILDRAEIRGLLTYLNIKTNDAEGYVIRIGDFKDCDYILLC